MDKPKIVRGTLEIYRAPKGDPLLIGKDINGREIALAAVLKGAEIYENVDVNDHAEDLAEDHGFEITDSVIRLDLTKDEARVLCKVVNGRHAWITKQDLKSESLIREWHLLHDLQNKLVKTGYCEVEDERSERTENTTDD